MKKILSIFLSAVLFTFALALTGCGEADGATKGRDYDIADINEGVTAADSEFAFNIFRELNSEDSGNSIFISPLSISAALTMTYNGAETTTKEVMSSTLCYNDIERKTVNLSYMNLLNYLENVDRKIELNIANSIWIREGEQIKEAFLSDNMNNFNARIEALDFSDKGAADRINKWISDATKKKIDKMIEPPIDPNTVMFLINAIYFKGEWSDRFDPENTFDGVFHTLDGGEQNVRMMHRNGDIEYTKGSDYKAVRLPYGNGNTSMYCILPDEGKNINSFIAGMSQDKWNEILDNITETDDVNLQIPKFKLEYGIKSLKDSLSSLGMEEAFEDRADFSGIREGLYIDEVLHKAVIEVNEEGSEAAAATVVVLEESAAVIEPVTFIADRPFMFVIADDNTGTILFMGKLLNIESLN